MSGIAGIIHFDGKPVEPGLIEKMTSAMAHRGPDGINHWVKGSVALGQCMLRTTPESLEEHQPLTNEDESLVLVMDGRVDNWEELRRELLGRGAVLRNRSDAELVLRAYEVWGDESPTRILGDFAYAIWDQREQTLFCARDHLGVRPFYYVRNDRFFAFASADEALAWLPEVSLRLNEDRLAYILVPSFTSFDFNVSWLRDIHKLGPGQIMVMESAKPARISTYWQPEPLCESQFSSDQDCEEAFRAVFTEAVRCRMRTIGHPALMLSGGMDSSSVVAVARELICGMPGKELHTFSTVSDNSRNCIESQHIEAVLQGDHRYAHFISVPSFRGEVSISDVAEAAWVHAHPVDNSILLPAMMYLAASRQGSRVLFDGVDGDLVTHTPDRYIARLIRDGAWRRAWSEARACNVNNTYQMSMSPWKLMIQNTWVAYAPALLRELRQRLRGYKDDQMLNNSDSIINPEFARRIHLIERLRSQRTRAARWNPVDFREGHARVMRAPGIVRSMEGDDRVAARYGVEPRHPWSDKRLVEFYLRLPLNQKVRDGWTKYLVRKAMEPLLSPGVRWRRGKESLGWQIICGLMDSSRGHGVVSRTIEAGLEPIMEYVNTNGIKSKFQAYGINRGDNDRELIFKVVTLALWLTRLRDVR